MLRDPAQVSLAYYNPFLPKNQQVLCSLENDEEWECIKELVRNNLIREKEMAKRR
jgi:hypothetical protein